MGCNCKNKVDAINQKYGDGGKSENTKENLRNYNANRIWNYLWGNNYSYDSSNVNLHYFLYNVWKTSKFQNKRR